MLSFGKQFSADRLLKSQRKPDRYAAAICIRVRPDGLLFEYSVGESCRCPGCEERNGLQMLSGPMEFSSNGYFFFFLVVFFAFFAFFAFLAMLPSVIPKLVQCKSTIDMHTFRIHHNYKFDTARFEEGKRPSLRRDEALA
jgi:hypothetical protein